MKHAVIVSHPNVDSFTLSVARAYQEAVEKLGGEVVVRDLYRMNFDPRLAATELPDPKGFLPGEDVVAERRLIEDADVFAFVYPLWFNAPPAMTVGYIDRVFGLGFGFGSGAGGNVPLLTGRKLISFSSSGAPKHWLVDTGGWKALQTLFDEHLAAICGFRALGHVHFGGVTPWMREDLVKDCLRRVDDEVIELFSNPQIPVGPDRDRSTVTLAPSW